MIQKYVALISYVGTNYTGWQTQAHETGHHPTIQETIEGALDKMIGHRVHLTASGRTDTGVHALGQVAHFTIDWSLPPRSGKPEITPYHLLRGLNTNLPAAIRILDLRKIDENFHAQLGAQKKQYSYYVQTGIAPSALHTPFSRFHSGPLSLTAMNEAAKMLVGEHDFKPFQAAGGKPMKTTVRKIFECEVTECPQDVPFPTSLASLRLLRIRVVGSGFLRHMVRGIAGTLMQIGSGKRPPTDMQRILETQDRELVGTTAQSQGLWLERVWYPEVDFSIPIPSADRDPGEVDDTPHLEP